MTNRALVTIRAPRVNLVSIAGDNATVEVFRPFAGKRFIVTKIIADPRSLTLGGTPTAPHVVVDNGTNGQNIVADVALPTTKIPKDLTVIVGQVVDNDNPLRIKKTTAAAATSGTAVYKCDFDIIGIFK